MFEDNLKKFLFVGVMIVVTLISNHTSKGNEQATVSFTLNGEPVNQEKTAVVAGSVTPSGTSGVLVEGSKKNDADLAPEPTDPAEKISASMLQQTGVVLGGGEKKDPEPEVVSGENFDRAFLTPEDRTVFEGQAEIEAGKSGSGFTKKSDQSFQNFSGSAALVADLLSGEEYLNLNGGRSWPIASITKLMTAAVASKNLDPELPIVVPVFGGELGGEVRKFNTGENVTMTNLLRLMLTASSNEAAEIFARAYGRASFIELMNVQAKAWGLKNTYFNDPTGLSVSNQ